MNSFVFTTPSRLVVGWGAATDARLVQEVTRLGRRPLLVVGKSLRASGALDTILGHLEKAGVTVAVHEGVPPEPTVDALQSAMEATEVANADCVVAIGGGSVLDVGKGAAALAGTGHTARDYFIGAVTVPETIQRPIIAVPTTAGTGSEATWVSVLTDKEAGEQYPRKASIRGGAMMPTVALLDAELTMTCPAHVTANSGMDAFVQAWEAYTSSGANPLTDALSLPAAQSVLASLSIAYHEPGDRAARETMLLASYMAGMALNTSRLGLVHGLAHPIGAVTGAAHGLICGLLMPAVMEFNLPVATEKYAVVFGVEKERLPSALKTTRRRLENLLADFQIPVRLSAIGVREEHLDYIAVESLKSGSTKANPRPVTAADARAVLLNSL